MYCVGEKLEKSAERDAKINSTKIKLSERIIQKGGKMLINMV